MAKPRTHSVRVRIREVPHMVVVDDSLGGQSLVQRSGFGPGNPALEPTTLLGPDADPESKEFQDALKDYKFGQRIDLLDEDYVRLRNHNAVMDDKDAEALPELEEQVLHVGTASVDELAEWIEQENPKVNDVVEASEGNADFARKLLEAEAQAHDGEPRKGVLDGLTVVISRG